ncbi:hypothetical protein SLEP1_g12705 [Rubroshorea leprosula]|uniref:Uncharacterized protein n=1 Tax=Rubroshorea leprosula TaxID=152421 RepID=A0AAV5IDD2_9ROSI|nr:hypothetical protein SLEP1_g12705 [Rubroshorea leprosula]
MQRARVFSSPDMAGSDPRPPEDPSRIEGYGLATNVKLLLKLIQENNEASAREQDDHRKPQRMAGMITILDDVRTRIQKSQSMIGKRSMAELRRCNTDLRPNHSVPRDRKPQEPVMDEKERLRRELTASLVARKSLEAMCSSLGKEKEIMASELAKKVQELNESEELIEGLKAQNETLLGKVQACAAEHKDRKCEGVEAQENAALMERNKALSEQLLRSLDGYRSLKRKYQNLRDENVGIQETLMEMGVEVAEGLGRIQGFRQRLASKEARPVDIEEEISALAEMLESFQMKISKQSERKSGWDKLKSKLIANNKHLLQEKKG